ncbi:hypothetical protein EI94DRAFT_1753924 [Lactarius quietus]|nr:hypothetical protein EI94DRAFT_1753924 [Lactarius quietus]
MTWRKYIGVVLTGFFLPSAILTGPTSAIRLAFEIYRGPRRWRSSPRSCVGEGGCLQLATYHAAMGIIECICGVCQGWMQMQLHTCQSPRCPYRNIRALEAI